MDRDTEHELLRDILPDDFIYGLGEEEDLPTPYESFLLGLCGVSSFTGLHHALRAGYGFDYDPLDFERYCVYTSYNGNCSTHAVGRSIPVGFDSSEIKGRSEGKGRVNRIFQAIKRRFMGTNGDKIQAKLAKQRDERSKLESVETIESASIKYDFGRGIKGNTDGFNFGD